MKKLITRKGIILVIIPLFTIFLQCFLRIILDKDLNTIGITFAALGLGQLLPFLYFDHFIVNKVLNIKPHYSFDKNEFKIIYKAGQNVNSEEIDSVKNWFYIAIFINLSLFLCVIYLGLAGKIVWHIIFGSISCLISWYLLVFKW